MHAGKDREKMIIETKYLGKMEIDKANIIFFESGLPGFKDENKFVILDIPENEVMQILQSVNTPHLAFIVTNPHYFYKEYEFELDEPIVESLQITDKNQIVILTIMTIHDPFHTSTINLQAPLIINSKTKRAKQYILPNEAYDVKATISLPARNEKGV